LVVAQALVAPREMAIDSKAAVLDMLPSPGE